MTKLQVRVAVSPVDQLRAVKSQKWNQARFVSNQPHFPSTESDGTLRSVLCSVFKYITGIHVWRHDFKNVMVVNYAQHKFTVLTIEGSVQ